MIVSVPSLKGEISVTHTYFYSKEYLDFFYRTQFLIYCLFLIYKYNCILYRARPCVRFPLLIRTTPFHHPHLHTWKLRTYLAPGHRARKEASQQSPAPACSPDTQAFILVQFLMHKLCSIQWCQVRVTWFQATYYYEGRNKSLKSKPSYIGYLVCCLIKGEH